MADGNAIDGLTVVQPQAVLVDHEFPLTERPASPDGLRLGLREFWFGYDRFTRAFERRLKSHHDVPSVSRIDGTRPRTGRVLEAWNEFHQHIDWALVGFGGCGGCAPWAVEDAIELERNGIPTVTIVSEDMAGVVELRARTDGYPRLRILTLSHFMDDLTDQQMEELAEEMYGKIIDALTRPLA